MKVFATNFRKETVTPFSFEKGGKTITTKYWVLPSEFMEDKEKLSFWIEKSAKVQ